AIESRPTGLKNTDGDPRGYWKGGNKGARKPDYPYGTHVPPYRWRLVTGQFPPGVWRLNEQSGVIWAESLEAAGEFDFVVECADSSGATTQRDLRIEVAEKGVPPETKLEVPWLWSPPPAGGALTITSEELPVGVVGHPYFAMIQGSGGSPYLGEKWQ